MNLLSRSSFDLYRMALFTRNELIFINVMPTASEPFHMQSINLKKGTGGGHLHIGFRKYEKS